MNASANVSMEEIRAVLIDDISDALKIAPTELSTDRPLQDYGADSTATTSPPCSAESSIRSRST